METIKASSHLQARSPEKMVQMSLCSRGIYDERVLTVMARVPRDLFVPETLQHRAYSDHPLPIGHDQTITQPYVVALMTQALKLKGQERVLEIGTGSGYQTVVLAKLARAVFSVERIYDLSVEAKKRFVKLGHENIFTRVGNGVLGWSEYAPYNGILVTAAVYEISPIWLEQLAQGGNLVVPIIQRSNTQRLVCFQKQKNQIQRKTLGSCQFVPLIG